jgi:hypothetical protein
VLPSDASGFDGPRRVVASMPGFAPAFGTPPKLAGSASPAGAPRSEDVGDIVLWRSATLRGRVLDESRAPLAGAWVRVSGDRWNDSGEGTRTDAEGWYVVDGVAGRSGILSVSAPGHKEQRMPLRELPPPGSVHDLEPVVLAAVTRRIRVLDPSGAPAANVRVLARSSFSWSDFDTAPATDADGWVTLDPKNDAMLHLRTEDGGQFRVSRRRKPNDAVVRLPATRRIEVRVVDEERRAVPLALLHLDRHDDDDSSQDLAEAEMSLFGFGGGADGSFRDAIVPARTIRLEVKAGGFVTRVVEIPAGARMPLEIVLERFGETHRTRLTELQAEIRALEAEIARDGPKSGPSWDDRHRRLWELQQEARRLTGE